MQIKEPNSSICFQESRCKGRTPTSCIFIIQIKQPKDLFDGMAKNLSSWSSPQSDNVYQTKFISSPILSSLYMLAQSMILCASWSTGYNLPANTKVHIFHCTMRRKRTCFVAILPNWWGTHNSNLIPRSYSVKSSYLLERSVCVKSRTHITLLIQKRASTIGTEIWKLRWKNKNIWRILVC